jgi:hypothetical protein
VPRLVQPVELAALAALLELVTLTATPPHRQHCHTGNTVPAASR